MRPADFWDLRLRDWLNTCRVWALQYGDGEDELNIDDLHALYDSLSPDQLAEMGVTWSTQ